MWDMWLSKGARQRYLACGDSHTRARWFPPAGNYDFSGRSKKDAITEVAIDQASLVPHFPEFGGPVTARKLETPDFSGTLDDGLLDVDGFTAVDVGNGVVRLLVANNRPSVDPLTGTPPQRPPVCAELSGGRRPSLPLVAGRLSR